LEKDFDTVLLLDTYAGLLTQKQLRLCDMYYNQDYSLAEIAQIEDTTRQAVRDGINKARQKLLDLEQSLHVQCRRAKTMDALQRARDAFGGQCEMKQLIDEISGIWENSDGV
jgi:predicted DNA-binding protein YlxM (UPF0122 family)